MNLVRSNDLFKVKLASFLTDFDRKVLSELYQPMIGYGALSLFMTLWSKHERKAAIDFTNHSILFETMQISLNDFVSAKRKLEAVGLLRTFVKEEDEHSKYLYILYGPKSPKEFFDDVLFSGTLTKYIGEKQATKIARSFECTNRKENEEYKENSASFLDEFNPNFEDDCFSNKLSEVKTYGRKVRKVDTEFDFVSFFEQMKNDYDLNKSLFSKSELIEIERLSTLYGLDELTMSSLVFDAFNSTNLKGNRLMLDTLDELCKQEQNFIASNDKQNHVEIDSEGFDAEITLMEKLSCKDYLVYMQKGTKASSADLNIISSLSKEYKLTTNAINAIIYYTLDKCDNKLPRKYIEKLAAYVARCELETAADVYQYLNKNEIVQDKKSSFMNTPKVTKELDVNDYEDDDVIDEDLAKQLKNAGWR